MVFGTLLPRVAEEPLEMTEVTYRLLFAAEQAEGPGELSQCSFPSFYLPHPLVIRFYFIIAV